MVAEMLDKGMITLLKSPVWWSVLVRKDGRLHFCVDYRKLNAVTKMDVFPLPHIDNSLDMLADTKHLTTLDFASGYWQVPMEPETKEKTVFCTPSSSMSCLWTL